jgi:tetratricopeptide (TPR) repeat protein
VRVHLSGLLPTDAEALLRSCEISGSSSRIQAYLQRHCDCHPLVTGVLAGLVYNYLPDRGNFDAWEADPAGGGQLNLADLDLKNKRLHILHAALAALSDKSRELLSTLALLSEAADYATLSALNPHRPERQAGPGDFRHASEELARTVKDLERRGLLQYDIQSRRYDLHPVVRGIAADGLGQTETSRFGQRVVDHFSQQAQDAYDTAECLDDLRHGLQVVRTLLRMGRTRSAYKAFAGGLHEALLLNVECYPELLSLVRGFLPNGWNSVPPGLTEEMSADLAREAGRALNKLGQPAEALAAYGFAIRACMRTDEWGRLRLALFTAAQTLGDQRRYARRASCLGLAMELAEELGYSVDVFKTRLGLFLHLAEVGRWIDAEQMWQRLDRMGRGWPRHRYRPGDAERAYAQFRFWRGDLTEEHLAAAAEWAGADASHAGARALHALRGQWWMQQGQWEPAAESLRAAVRMAREAGILDGGAEARLALALFHRGALPDPYAEAERIARAPVVHDLPLAELWLALSEREKAEKHALAAYRFAWADGEPYTHRYETGRARDVLEQLGAPLPDLPPYDPARDAPLAWEKEVRSAIQNLKRG